MTDAEYLEILIDDRRWSEGAAVGMWFSWSKMVYKELHLIRLEAKETLLHPADMEGRTLIYSKKSKENLKYYRQIGMEIVPIETTTDIFALMRFEDENDGEGAEKEI